MLCAVANATNLLDQLQTTVLNNATSALTSALTNTLTSANTQLSQLQSAILANTTADLTSLATNTLNNVTNLLSNLASSTLNTASTGLQVSGPLQIIPSHLTHECPSVSARVLVPNLLFPRRRSLLIEEHCLEDFAHAWQSSSHGRTAALQRHACSFAPVNWQRFFASPLAVTLLDSTLQQMNPYPSISFSGATYNLYTTTNPQHTLPHLDVI